MMQHERRNFDPLRPGLAVAKAELPQGPAEIASIKEKMRVSEDEKEGLAILEMFLEEAQEKKKAGNNRTERSAGTADPEIIEGVVFQSSEIDMSKLSSWDRALLKSRERRLSNEEQNKKDKDDLRSEWVGGKAIAEVQDILAGTGRGFLGKLALRWGVRGLGIEGPTAFATVYGLGDATSLISSLAGRDILTGERLDLVDRGIFLAAAAIPYVSAIYLADPIRYVRKKLEDSVYNRLTGDKARALKDAEEAYATGKGVVKLAKGAFKELNKDRKQAKPEKEISG